MFDKKFKYDKKKWNEMSEDPIIKTEEKRIISEPNMKVEIKKKTGKHATSEVTVSYSGNISQFDPALWADVVSRVKSSVQAAVEDILKALEA